MRFVSTLISLLLMLLLSFLTTLLSLGKNKNLNRPAVCGSSNWTFNSLFPVWMIKVWVSTPTWLIQEQWKGKSFSAVMWGKGNLWIPLLQNNIKPKINTLKITDTVQQCVFYKLLYNGEGKEIQVCTPNRKKANVFVLIWVADIIRGTNM